MISLQWFFGEKEPLTDAHYIREEVFVKEQNVSMAEEHDGTDGNCIHLVAYVQDENGKDIPASTGRIMLNKEDYVIGRVATLKNYRGQGIATIVMDALVDACVTMGSHRKTLHAQLTARSFYENLGFTAYGDEFMDAGIPHIAMEHFGTNRKCGGGQHAT